MSPNPKGIEAISMNRTRKLMTASMLTALTCLATMVIKIPSPLQGYLNLGDCVVLCCGWVLGPVYGFWAAGMGSGLADLLSGYALYAPATFLIKGAMAAAAWVIWHKLEGKSGSRLLSGVCAELLMIGGYLAFESVLYGFGPALVNVPANGMQGLAGLILGVLLAKNLREHRLMAL